MQRGLSCTSLQGMRLIRSRGADERRECVLERDPPLYHS